MTTGQKPGQQSRRSAKETPPDEQSGETSPVVSKRPAYLDAPDDIRQIAEEMCGKYVGYDGPSEEEIVMALWNERQRWTTAEVAGPSPVLVHDDVRAWIAEHNEEALLADGFEDAIIGIAERCSKQPLVVYDAEKCIKILMERDGMEEDEAAEFFQFNTLGAWMGEHTPLFLWKYESDLEPYKLEPGA